MRQGDTEMGGRGEFGKVRSFLRLAASPRLRVGSFVFYLRNLCNLRIISDAAASTM